MFLAAFRLAALAALACLWSPAAAGGGADDLQAKRAEVRAVFEGYCIKCHQEDGDAPNRKIEKFGFILDFETLEASKYVVAGDPEASTIYTSVKSDKMPEFADIGMTKAVPDEGKAAIVAWIEALGAAR